MRKIYTSGTEVGGGREQPIYHPENQSKVQSQEEDEQVTKQLRMFLKHFEKEESRNAHPASRETVTTRRGRGARHCLEGYEGEKHAANAA